MKKLFTTALLATFIWTGCAFAGSIAEEGVKVVIRPATKEQLQTLVAASQLTEGDYYRLCELNRKLKEELEKIEMMHQLNKSLGRIRANQARQAYLENVAQFLSAEQLTYLLNLQKDILQN